MTSSDPAGAPAGSVPGAAADADTRDHGPAGGADAGTPPPDAGTVEPVPGTATGLRREVGRMPDGRRITYYWSARA